MHKDSTGREISKGSYIAYVAGTGSRASIKFAVVVKLKQKDTTRNEWDHQTKTYNTVPHTKYSIQVVTAMKSYKGTYPNGQEFWTVPKADGKPAHVNSIERLDRIVLLEKSQMIPEVAEVLEKEMYDRGAL